MNTQVINKNKSFSFLGKKHTAETKRKIGLANSIALKGKKLSEEHKRRMSLALKGRIFSKETLKKMSEANKGRFLGIAPWNKGKRWSEETKKKMSESHKGKNCGENHPKWISDRTLLVKKQERNDYSYKNFVKEVKKRDEGICRLQNKNCSGYKIVHHILSLSEYPEERYNINNGITLCQYHHPRKREDERRLIPTLQELVELNKL